MFLPIVFGLAFALVGAVTGFRELLAVANAALFATGLFWIYRAFVPTRIYVRVKEIIRYRYTLLSLELACVGVVVTSPGFLKTFSTVSRCSLALTLSVLAMVATLEFFRRDSQLILFFAFFMSGALALIHPAGLAAVAGVMLTQFYVYLKCNTAMRLASTDDAYGGDYRDEMRPVFQSLSTAFNSLILDFIAFSIGLAVATGLQWHLTPDFSVRGFLTDYLQEVKGCVTVGVIFRSLIGGMLALFAVVRSRRLTDISDDHSMGNSLIVVYGFVFVASLIWPMGLLERLPLFASWQVGALRSQSFLPDVFASVALLVSASVFVVELCCREDERAFVERRHGILVSKTPSRFKRKLRAGGLAAVTLLVVAVSAYLRLFR